ncbi:MAG TPA: hypothetical protein VFU57_05200 [Candidatus Acidoferrales bacterium]|nr:hypothetical protein [Candidatus Acidoferrales bacterium]
MFRESFARVFATSVRKTLLGCIAAGVAAAAVFAASLPNLFPFHDSSGVMETNNINGRFDESGPFFQSLGTNGRSCATCHRAENAMGLSAARANEIFQNTHGHDPLFSTVDGAVCPTATSGHPLDFSLLRKYGLIHVSVGIHANPQFTMTTVYDPYGCAIVTDSTGVQNVSVYRRPLAASNLRFITSVMFDGRETVAPLNDQQTFAANLVTDLKHQAMDATLGHAQATAAPSDEQQTQMAEFELALNSAQTVDTGIGSLDSEGALGGPRFLTKVPFFPGINDALGADPTGAEFNSNAFNLYSEWLDSGDPHRRSVARGEEIFNNHPLTITSVRGLNDALNQPAINGTCTTCHDAPNIGNHSVGLPLEIGTSRTVNFETNPVIQAAVSQLSMPNLPVYQLVCNQGPDSGEVVYTSDPGKALLTGNCVDIGRGKGLVLRGLAARAPYFHNGSAATLEEVVEFYNTRFQMNLTEQEKRDLVNFLKTL